MNFPMSQVATIARASWIPIALSLLLSACHSDSIVDASDARNQDSFWKIIERNEARFARIYMVLPQVN
jgi:hypothetical protein